MKKLLKQKKPAEKDFPPETEDLGAPAKDLDPEKTKKKKTPMMKQLKDKENSSEDENQSVPDFSDFEEEDPPTSGDNDDDVFQGIYAIRDKGEAGMDSGADRFSCLPAKVQKHVENFERAVLDSIPKEVSEPMPQIACRVASSLHTTGLVSQDNACESHYVKARLGQVRHGFGEGGAVDDGSPERQLQGVRRLACNSFFGGRWIFK